MSVLLPPDAWVLIGLHLRPRYLARLMLVSKDINKLVDNENYWTRVAAQLVLRDFNTMEVLPFASEYDSKPRIPHDLYCMMGLDHGYYWGMQMLLQRMEDMIDYHMKEETDEPKWWSNSPGWWDQIKAMTLAERTTEFYVMNKVINNKPITGNEFIWSMKDIAAAETLDTDLFEPADRHGLKRRVICEIEDCPMPSAIKQNILQDLKIAFGMEEARWIRWPKMRG
jgi:hypothetical protein